MIQLPNRLEALTKKLEAGEPVTRGELDRIASLQALDLAAAGESFVREACQRDDQATRDLKATLEAL